ncbi:TRAFAC clade GTPase domain-containing protein [Nocardiopsis alkaliphila]|uniref:TRAFAC clade GTPase domain-containing protein n=1 Tax=Nocardiopsis alkaliphila TaxID=225762 RepID=UPI00034512D3|nr:hypothetical protein [Nocardiopsis alkaliphila]
METVRIVIGFGVCAVIVACALALALGATWSALLHLRRVHEVIHRGENPRVRPLGPQESAWPGYHAGPLWWDLAEVHRRVLRETGLFAPFIQPLLLLQAALALAHLVLAWSGVVLLRLMDGALLAARRIRMVCPHCFECMPYPSYGCDGCGRRHRDVRPGSRGVFRRRCACGRDLPTLLLLGSADLATRCPHCDHALEHRPGEDREFVLPLFGATGAGKTRLSHGLHQVLTHTAGHDRDVHVESMGEETRHRLRDSEAMLRPRHRTAPTPPGRRARGLTLRVVADRRALSLQVYDTAGEWFNTTGRTEELTYLGKAGTFLLVVDPLAVPAVWNALDVDEQRRLAGDRSGATDPEQAYMQVRDQVRRQYRTLGADAARSRLAVVVTRGDLLAGTTVDPTGTPPEPWMREVMGTANLLRAAHADFGTVEVFVTSAVVDHEGVPDPSLAVLLRWVLAREAGVFGTMLTDTHGLFDHGAGRFGDPAPVGPGRDSG